MAMNATVSNLDMAVGSIVLALISAGIYIFFISPAAKRRRLELTGLRGPKPEFPLGNMSEMGKKNRAPAPGHSTITHDIHSTIFPYFSRWRESYGTPKTGTSDLLQSMASAYGMHRNTLLMIAHLHTQGRYSSTGWARSPSSTLLTRTS